MYPIPSTTTTATATTTTAAKTSTHRDERTIHPTNHKELSWSDIHIDDKLGEGTFCSVHRIYIKRPSHEVDHEEMFALKRVTERPS